MLISETISFLILTVWIYIQSRILDYTSFITIPISLYYLSFTHCIFEQIY